MKKLLVSLFLFLLGFGNFLSVAYPPMDRGALDRNDEAFDYFAYPSGMIGVMDGAHAAQITAEGNLYTGEVELAFFVGEKCEPVNQRVKSLLEGWLPVVDTNFSSEKIDYQIRSFAAILHGDPESNTINFVKVTITNSAKEKKKIHFWTALRFPKLLGYARGAHHFRASFAKKLFTEDIFYEKIMATCDEYLVLMYPETMSIEDELLHFCKELRPDEEVQLVFKLPLVPIPMESGEIIKSLEEAEFNAYLDAAVEFWKDFINKGTIINLPEEKVINTYRANLVYEFIARDKENDDYVVKPNEFQYDRFWLRDGAIIVYALDVAGFPEAAEESALYFLKYQTADGNFQSQKGQLDGFGQTLWTFGRHYQLTKNIEFAKTVYPAVDRAIEWLKNKRSQSKEFAPDTPGYGLLPRAMPFDNEMVEGHLVGHNLWALTGLENAIILAKAVGAEANPREWEEEYKDYRGCILAALEEIARRTGGYISPAVEAGGYDWGNLKLVYISGLLAPGDPRVTATLDEVRTRFAEGIFTYENGKFLHHYLTIDIPQTELIRGEQKKVLEVFYALLLHTSSLHAGFEWNIVPWADRHFGGNFTPHCAFSGKFIELLRNMLVREEKDTLHLCSCISPEWLKPAGKIEMLNAPTDFGKVSFTARPVQEGIELQLSLPGSKSLKKVIVHVPPNYNIVAVEKDGQFYQDYKDTEVAIPARTKQLKIQWKQVSDLTINYIQTVEEYKTEYQERVGR